MATTIQISEKLQGELTRKKLYERETYEEIIWDLLEDTLEVNAATKKEILSARKEIAQGKQIPLAAVKRKLGI